MSILTTQTHTIRRGPWDLPHKFHPYLIYFNISMMLNKIFESTLHDIFVYKAGAFTYFFALKKTCFLKSIILQKFWNQWYSNILKSMIFKYFDDIKLMYYSMIFIQCYYLVFDQNSKNIFDFFVIEDLA